MNIVLMAGGGGTRLWPLSRQEQPKQFLDFGTGKTLIELAYERAAKLTTPDKIYLATQSGYATKSQALLPAIPSERIFLEPEKRDTTAAFASVALRLQHINQGNEPVLFMWCDHIFTNEAEFLNDLKKVPDLVSKYPTALVLLGHTPVTPETTLGYIEAGSKIDGFHDVFNVKQFREKPDRDTAKHFVAAGNFFWNLGYFSTTPDYLIQALNEISPDINPAITAYARSLSSQNETKINQAFSLFPKVSIEYTLIEKLPQIIAITGDYGWSDVGNWGIVKQIFGELGAQSLTGAPHVNVGSKNNYIYNTTDKAVSMIGMKDTIVVVTNDAILITDLNEAHRVKEIVQNLEESGSKHLL
jgi:mannose-1-phosphate guanylyltransferase